MNRYRRFLMSFFILTLMTFGFWVNYKSFTLIIDVVGLSLFGCYIYSNKCRIHIPSEGKVIYQAFILFLIGILFVTWISWLKGIPFTMCILGSRDYFEFMLIGFIIRSLILNEEHHDRFLVYITVFAVVMCGFGIVQFFFHDHLPDELLHVRSGRLDYVYGLGTLIFRINALFENSIVFDGIIIIASALVFGSLLVRGKSVVRLVGFGITIAANILTFSRVSIIGSILVYVVEYLILGKKGKLNKHIKIIIVGTLVIFLFVTFGSETAVYQRLFNTNITMTSDIVHSSTIRAAGEAVRDNLFLGLGMGTQGYDSAGSAFSVIRDGCWFQFALELGLPLTVLYGFILLLLIYTAMKKTRTVKRESQAIACGSYVAIMVYFVLASFINSAYNAKEVFGLCWVITGMMLWNPPNEVNELVIDSRK